MRELATRAGMSQPFLSNLENSRAMPSIATLYKIAQALGVSARDFLPDEPDETVVVVRRGGGPQGPVGDEEGSALSRLVAGAPGRILEAHTYEIDPGNGLGGWFQHDGEDLLVIIEGSLTAEFGDGRRVELGEGDVLWHLATLPHRWLATGPGTARVLLVTAHPLPSGGPPAHSHR